MATHPNKLTSKTLRQFAMPSQEVPTSPTPALFMSTATYITMSTYKGGEWGVRANFGNGGVQQCGVHGWVEEFEGEERGREDG